MKHLLSVVSGGFATRREVAVSILRKALGAVILVISGQSRMMYRNLEPKSEGSISPKRSRPQADPGLLTTRMPA
jgi:hypothetical protein